MSTTRIKVCDVRSLEVATQCQSMGVDLIGLHGIRGPLLEEKLLSFRAIVNSNPRCEVVLVTRQKDVEIVVGMLLDFSPDYVQLHADWSAAEIEELRASITHCKLCVKVIGVGHIDIDDVGRLNSISPLCDLLLLDSSLVGGSGILGSRETIRQMLYQFDPRRLLIAGGLTPRNVTALIEEFDPWGVDVQSGVEVAGGSRTKDPQLISDFVSSVREALPRK